MMFSKCKSAIILLGFCLALFPSCTARIAGSLAADGSAQVSVSMSLMPRMTALVQRMFTVGGQEGPVLDGTAFARSLSDAPGVASVTFRNTAPSAIEGQVNISHINDFLSAVDGGGFINFEPGRLQITIERENGPVLLEMLSYQISDFLNALMAPIATGEDLTKDEYLDLVTSFYSAAISSEIASSVISATIDFPGTITSITGGTTAAGGRRAIFEIPLVDLLVLETPLVYTITWN